MRLPNAENVLLILQNYAMTALKGKHRARVFLEKLGITSNDAQRLSQLILEATLTAEATEQEPTD